MAERPALCAVKINLKGGVDMFKRLGILVVAAIAVFVFAGVVSASLVNVISPNGGETLTAGQVWKVSIDINYAGVPTNIGVGKYKLSYSCQGSDYISDGQRIWKVITIRQCGLFSCPTDYLWEVPNVQISVNKPSRQCKVKVQLFDLKGGALGSDKSDDWFTITPYSGVPADIP
jgi:hypothetical protein